jgi:predicted membrane channel-forming protein YqfA (hemolysin III family)
VEKVAPNLLESLSFWAEWALAPIVALAISAVYFFASASSASLARRFLVSGHGALIAAIYCGAMGVALLGHSSPQLGDVFGAVLALPFALIVVSLMLYPGRKRIHFLQIPNLLCLGWTAIWGGMAVTGKWL